HRSSALDLGAASHPASRRTVQQGGAKRDALLLCACSCSPASYKGATVRPGTTQGRKQAMHTLTIGDVTITSLIERDGPWRKPEDMFPAYDPAIGRRHLAELDPVVFDPASGRMVITYQTFVVRTPKHTVLIDTCTGE